MIVVDDKIEIIDQNNRPRYINNELIGNEGGQFVFDQINFDGQTIMIGSDGVEDLIEGLDKGLIDEYENLEEFIKDESNFKNPVHIPKLLKKYALKGILKDDCTLIMIKR